MTKRHRHLRRWAGATTVALLLPLLGVPAASAATDRSAAFGHASTSTAAPAAGAARARRPDIVVVVMDDASMELLPTMRNVRRLRRSGATYTNAFVVDSLCCVSRSSILTGQYPHQTGVRTNTANVRKGGPRPVGGWPAFERYGNEARSVNVRLKRRANYTTGFVGKYLNQYSHKHDPALQVPKGWDTWTPVMGDAYDQWRFRSGRKRPGHPRRLDLVGHGAPPASASRRRKDRAYAGEFIRRQAVSFVKKHRGDRRPYFLMVTPYGPHRRTTSKAKAAYDGQLFPAMFRDRPRRGNPGGNCGVRCGTLGARDLPGFGDRVRDNAPRFRGGRRAPNWRGRGARPHRRVARRNLRNRARMVQSIDRMIGQLRRNVKPNTYIVVTSDNGMHNFQHGLRIGKGTPFESDTHVPLVIDGPGVPAGKRTEVTSNIDLAPTIEQLARVKRAAYRSGRSLVPSLRHPRVGKQSRYVYFEHTWAKSRGFDPDLAAFGAGINGIPSYVAVRSRNKLLVRFDLQDGRGHRFAYEYYNYRRTGWEKKNGFTRLSAAKYRKLRVRLRAFQRCSRKTRNDRITHRCRVKLRR